MSPMETRVRNILRDPSRLQTSVPLARHTTFRIGGPADYLVAAHTSHEVCALVVAARECGVPLYVLGNGSNLLVADAGVRGLVLTLAGDLAALQIEGERVRVGAGFNLPKLALTVARQGLGGLTFACAIPGTVGAGVVINAGAHDGELSQVVETVQAVRADGHEVTLTPAELGFGYRSSRLVGEPMVVTRVVMRLFPADGSVLAAQIQRYLEHRRATQPLQQPNAGSIFKNPPGDFAGRLIEAGGCKGWREGDAQVSTRHANFIVNLGQATARDVVTLMRRVRSRVQEQFGVRLEPEIRFWGPPEQFL